MSLACPPVSTQSAIYIKTHKLSSSLTGQFQICKIRHTTEVKMFHLNFESRSTTSKRSMKYKKYFDKN